MMTLTIFGLAVLVILALIGMATIIAVLFIKYGNINTKE